MNKYTCMLCVFAMLFGADTFAQVKKGKSCSQDKVCVHSEQSARQVILFVENKMDYPVTVKIVLTLKNMVVLEHQQVIDSYPGASRVKALTLKAKDKSKKWSWKYKFYWQRGMLEVSHDDDYVYRLPYALGSRHKLTQAFGGKYTHQKDNYYGLDFEMPVGTKIYAAREGRVAGIKEDSKTGCKESKCRNDGNFVAIMHSDGTLGEYFHLKHQGALVEPGQKIKKGQLIGLSGNTGWSNKPHLHFSVHSGSKKDHRLSHPVKIQSDWGVISNPRAGRFYIAVK